MTDEGGGFYIADFPLDVTTGQFTLVGYLQSGGSPADTDNVIGSYQVNWDGEFITECATSQELQDAVDALTVLINLAIEAGKSTLYISSSVTEAR